MGKLYVIIGKSASGKDSIYKALLADKELGLKPFVSYTTRPIRSGETDGREYHFSDEDKLREYEKSGKLIEKRVYHTVHGDWYYFNVDSDQVDLDREDYLCIGTLESFIPTREYYGNDKVIPIYVYIDDGIRIERALKRERSQASPRYAEMCRRFLGDEKDFSEERIRAAGIEERFENNDLGRCLENIREYILSHADI